MDRSLEERVELKAALDHLVEAVAVLGRAVKKRASASASKSQKCEADRFTHEERITRLFGSEAFSAVILEESNMLPFDEDAGRKSYGLADHLVRLEDRKGPLLVPDCE